MPEVITLTDLLDDAAILSLEHQLHAHEVLGEHSWDVDLADSWLEFTGPLIEFTNGPTINCNRFYWLGSAAPGPRSWLWAWANPTPGCAESVTALSSALRDFGQQHGIAELTSAEVPFDSLPGSPTDAAETAVIIADAAKSVTGHWTSYSGRIGGSGTRMVFLIEHPAFQLPPPTGAGVTRLITQAISALRLTDHRRAVHSYAIRRQLQAVFASDDTRLTITGPGFETTIEVDQYNRVSGIDTTMEGS
jgi:hypothetical protein